MKRAIARLAIILPWAVRSTSSRRPGGACCLPVSYEMHPSVHCN